MAKARMGVIGAGWWATQFHIPSLKTYEKADLVGIADVKPEKAAAAAGYYDVRNTYDDHRELLAAGVDGVVIAVQHAYHYEVARDALDAGVHVLVEKPMTLTAAHAWDLVERAKTNGLHLMVGYTYQFTRHAQAARDIVQSGRIGELQLVSGIFTSWVESYLRGRPEGLRRGVRLSGHGTGARQLLGPQDGRRRPGPPAGYAPDGHGAVGHRPAGRGGLRLHGKLRPGRGPGRFVQLQAGQWGIGHDGFHRRHAARTSRSTRPSSTRAAAASCARTSPGAGWRHTTNDGTSEQFPDLSGQELYPAHLPSRGLTDLALGAVENRAPGELGARVVEFLEAGYRSAASRRSIEVGSLLQARRKTKQGLPPASLSK